MDTIQAIKSRRSSRRYMDKALARQDLELILEAATYAPSGVNLQPWYFVLAESPEAMMKVNRVMEEVSRSMRPMLERRFPKHPEVVDETTSFVHRLGGAPACLMAFQKEPVYENKMGVIMSVAAAVQNALLAATALGIDSCWLTAPLETGQDDLLRDTFAPGRGPLLSIVTLGYAVKPAKAPPRKEGRWAIV